MRAGKFPKEHPCSNNPKPMTFGNSPASDDPLGEFRKRGYPNASCFPEGDGIAFDCDPAKDDSQVEKDIAECFGWEIEPAINFRIGLKLV